MTSLYDPIDSTQYSLEEMKVAVDCAQDWGTYVMAHVYTPKGIKRAIQAGIQSIEHGQLATLECAQLMADRVVWWSLQPFFGDADANIETDPKGKAAQQMIGRGTEQAYALARELRIRTAWGTDILFTPRNVHTHGHQLAKLTRFYEPLELLRIATAGNGALCQLSGDRSPYPGKLGTLEPGAHADLLVVDGDPSQSLDFLATPDNSLKLIMKDGRIHKNTLG
ncbi:amidohydrolase family protein [Orrella marina]|uniref:amidohydrolase family protein n=1 Tax=Orrella marina TaxID=2163011 RepID=UPI001D132125|nr:amidohydrolase family protein [Orrella marina]